MIGKCCQCVPPHRIDVRAQFGQGLRIEAKVVAGAAPFLFHQARRLQYLEMLRYGRTADWKLAGQLPDGRRTPPQQLENGLAGRIGESRQALPSVSHNLP